MLCRELQSPHDSDCKSNANNLYDKFQRLLLGRNYREAFLTLQRFLDCIVNDKKSYSLISYYCCLFHWYFGEDEKAILFCNEGLGSARAVENEDLIEKFKGLSNLLHEKADFPMKLLFEEKYLLNICNSPSKEELIYSKIQQMIHDNMLIDACMMLEAQLYLHPSDERLLELKQKLLI